LKTAQGTRIKLATRSLPAAITSDEASAWANRMRIEAVDTNKIPANVARMGKDFRSGVEVEFIRNNCNASFLDNRQTHE
jgi:hypothetical protein